MWHVDSEQYEPDTGDPVTLESKRFKDRRNVVRYVNDQLSDVPAGLLLERTMLSDECFVHWTDPDTTLRRQIIAVRQ